MGENPDDGDDGEGGDDFHAGEIEGRAVGADVALHQEPAGGAAEQIRNSNTQPKSLLHHKRLMMRVGDAALIAMYRSGMETKRESPRRDQAD